MKKLELSKAADAFDMVSDEHQVFYNIETGEFDYYTDPVYSGLDDDYERFEEDCWIAVPGQRELGEYSIMEDFIDIIADPRKNELLSVAIEGRGAFRRFKDTLHRVGMTDEWYAFKNKAYIELARAWCEDNDIEYVCDADTGKPEPAAHINPDNILIIPLSELKSKIAEETAFVLRSALGYSKSDAVSEAKRMLSPKRVGFAAINRSSKDSNLSVIGTIGAIPQYGTTGWELHPLAVLKEYQRRGIGRLLVDALEYEVVKRGGVMIYLGSDDKAGTTSLYGIDLYEDTFDKLKNIQNTGGHLYTFYEKMGYKVVGVFPDANGLGKPDIWMAKSICK